MFVINTKLMMMKIYYKAFLIFILLIVSFSNSFSQACRVIDYLDDIENNSAFSDMMELFYNQNKLDDAYQAYTIVSKYPTLRVSQDVINKVMEIVASGRIPPHKLQDAIDTELGEILDAANSANRNLILERLNLNHVDEVHFDKITYRLNNYSTGSTNLLDDLITNPDWFETFDDILRRPGDYWDIVDEVNLPNNSALNQWANGFWWKDLREKASNFELLDVDVPGSGVAKTDFISNSGLNANNVVDQVTLEVNGTKVRMDYMGKKNGKYDLGDAKFSTKDKDWANDWLNSTTTNQTTVYPQIQAGGNTVTIKASSSGKKAEIEAAFGITMQPSGSGTFKYDIPASDINSLKIIGSEADDFTSVKEIVNLL